MKKSTIVLGIAALISAAFLAVPSPVMADCGKMVIVYYVWPSPPPPPPQPPRNCWCDEVYPQQHMIPRRQFRNPLVDQTMQVAERGSINVNADHGSQVNVTVKQPEPLGYDSQTPVPNYDPQTPSTVRRGMFEEVDYTNSSNDDVVRRGEADRTGVGFGPDDAFAEPNQQAVIGWNGREEVLILSTNEKSTLPKGAAMLSVLPLPGKPVSIERANIKSFVTAKVIFDEKNVKAGGSESTSFGVVYSTKIGSHNIFVWEIESTDDFKGKVQGYIAETYKNKAAAVITPDTLKVIDQYVKEGFKHFAFDLTIVEDEVATKEAIAYRFRSDYVYFPLRISQVGGVGDTFVDLIVLTPLGDKKMTFAKRSGVGVNYPGLQTFFAQEPFSSKDLNDIDKSLADLFGNQTVYGRAIMFRASKIDSFQNDFEAVPLQ